MCNRINRGMCIPCVIHSSFGGREACIRSLRSRVVQGVFVTSIITSSSSPEQNRMLIDV